MRLIIIEIARNEEILKNEVRREVTDLSLFSSLMLKIFKSKKKEKF